MPPYACERARSSANRASTDGPPGPGLEPARLLVEPPDRGQLLRLAELRLHDRRFHHLDRAVVDFQRHGIGVAVLAAVGDREPRRVAEPVGRAVDDLGDLRERAHRAGADPRHEQEVGEILRAAVGGRREIGVQAADDDVLGPHVVARRHDEMRQERLQRRLGRLAAGPRAWPTRARFRPARGRRAGRSAAAATPRPARRSG